MSTTHPCFVGQRIFIPQFHLQLHSTPKSLNPEFSTNKRSNFCVSIGISHPLASYISTRNPKKPSLSCLRNCAAVDDADTNSCKWDWDRWNRHFSEIEEIEIVASFLKFKLEEAIKKEDFEEAAKLKTAIGEATVNDAVAEIMCQLQTAVHEERYHDASRLCIQTGSGLVGWWADYHQDSEEPFGRIVRIEPGLGRFIGKSYSPRQLATAAAGTPLFEIFVVKNTDGGYVMQVVYLQHVKQKPSIYENFYFERHQSSDVRGSEVKMDKKEDKLLNADEPTEEGIKSVMNFLKDKIPGINLKLMDVIIPEKEIVGSDDAIEELVGEGIEETTSADEEEEYVDDNNEELASMDTADSGNHLNTKHVIGEVLNNIEELFTEDELVRVSADIMDNERDSFILHVPGRSKSCIDTRKNTVSKEQVTAVAAQEISDLMPPEVGNALCDPLKASLKVSRNVCEIEQKGNRFCEYTTFNRIISPKTDLDLFDGIYVSVFGHHGTEIVQLKRKYGQWNDAEGSNFSDMDLFEYVEAVKLTGGPNVPAGQVLFRAKIGKQSRTIGLYPDESGVLASYTAQGRTADFGFKNPKWVEGKLLELNGKGPFLKGADLGFLYFGDMEKYFVALTRLRLPH